MKTKGLGRGLDALLGNSEEINNAEKEIALSKYNTLIDIDELNR